MVRVILREHPFARPASFEVMRSFRDAFGLTLAQGKPIADCIAYGEGETPDSDLHALVWPSIEANRPFWGVKDEMRIRDSRNLPSAEGSGNYISRIRGAFCHARYGCRSTFRRRKTVLASDGRGS
jgi:hypothetical protein